MCRVRCFRQSTALRAVRTTEQVPQVVAAGELGEPLVPAAAWRELEERRQRDVLGVGRPPRKAASGQRHHPAEVAVPERPERRRRRAASRFTQAVIDPSSAIVANVKRVGRGACEKIC